MLKPFLAACEVKSPKLAGIALVSIQKLLANDLVAAEGLLAVTRALEQVCSLHRSLCGMPGCTSWSQRRACWPSRARWSRSAAAIVPPVHDARLCNNQAVMLNAAHKPVLAAARALNMHAVHVACCMLSKRIRSFAFLGSILGMGMSL